MNSTSSPYCTRAEAADWLRCSVDTIDRMLTYEKKPQEGKLRHVAAPIGKLMRVRIVKADVLAMLPEPVGEK